MEETTRATGIPNEGTVESESHEPIGREGLHHWKQATIGDTSLDQRDGPFFAAVETTRMPMIYTDPRQPDNPIVFANNAFLDLTGYELDEVLGRNCRFLQGAGTDQEVVGQLRKAIEREEAISVEIYNYRKDGTGFWNGVFIAPVYDKENKLRYFFASQLDVTRRRETEHSFRQAQKMEAIGQLTAGLAHDFNNMLHVIAASHERMGAHRSDPQAFERYLAAAVEATNRGNKLTGQLLAFARRSRLEPHKTDLSALVGSFSELLDASAGSKVRLQINLERRLPTVMVDPVHLEMALLNVVINARDASPNGGDVVVSVASQAITGDLSDELHLEPGDYVVLGVTDQGIGMAPEVRARAVEPFFTTKPAGAGTGLGLAMATGFVHQSGGRLTIVSEVGKGTDVRMYFPVAREDSAPGNPQGSFRPTAVDATNAPIVLIVEDVRETAMIASEWLEELGYHTVVAYSGEDGLQRFQEAGEVNPISLVFSDVVMPGGMDGTEFARKIRQLDPNVPILMTTGYADSMVTSGRKPVSMDVIGKPYRRNELANRVEAALKRAPESQRVAPRVRSDFGPLSG